MCNSLREVLDRIYFNYKFKIKCIDRHVNKVGSISKEIESEGRELQDFDK